MADGMEKAAEDYGISIDIQATRTETDTAGQLSIAETMLANEYDSLVLSPLTNDNLNSAVQTALGNDTPVVNMNSVIPLSVVFRLRSAENPLTILPKRSAKKEKWLFWKACPELLLLFRE